jgi:autotransporter-associated beta strand protein
VERLEGRLVLAANGLPDLNSLLGASTAIYLDFDGHGAALGAYDVDGDPTTFNAAEAATITEAQRQVAAYYAMFDVNVTTVKPNVALMPTAWIVISNDVVGGTSNVGVFPNTQPQSWIDSASARTRASGIAHEIGHNFGLQHQSDYDLQGNKTSEYSNGTDDLHGALMGVDYRQDVNKWTLGHFSSSASALQDDIAVIAAEIKRYQPPGGDGFRADDFAGTISAATPLTLTAGGRSVTGVIERMADVDTFSFAASNTGAVISVVPTKPSGLDAKVEVFDATGALVAARDGDANEQQIVLPAGTGTWYVSVSSHGNYGDLGAYDLAVNDLPAGWASADIGATGLLGDARFSGGTYTVEGAGAAVGGTSDAFRFAWQQLTGDGSILARVTQNQNTDAWARAGVEIRESLAANSKHVAMVATSTQGPQLLSRVTTGGSTATVNGTAAPFTATWVRLVRVGNVITASRSTDGVTWTTVGSATVSMSATVFIGLLASATDAAKLNVAKFTNVALTGTINASETLNGLPAPPDVQIRQGGGASFVVNWREVAGATGYVIERSSNGVDFTSVFTAASSATSWTNTGLAGALRYFYRVRATNASGRSTASTIVSEVNRPSPVTAAAVTVLSSSQFVLNWIDTSGETGYRVEQSPDNVSFTQIATIGTNVPSYPVSGLAAGTPYWFRISPMSPTGDGNPVVITASTTGLQAVADLAFTTKASSAIGIAWTAVAAATTYRIERSTNGTSFTTLATVAAGTLAYHDATVAGLGKYHYRVVAINGTTVAEPSATIFTAAPAAVALPTPWTAVDVGSVAGDGATGWQSPKFVSVSSGTAIGGPADSLRFTHQPLVGDGSIIARVSSLENTNAAAKAGVMIRESTDANARQAVMVVSAANGIAWQYRQNVGGSGVVVAGPTGQAAPVWVKVTRTGTTFTGSWSSDGIAWTDVGTITIPMGSNALVGLAATSGADTLLNRAEFTNVAVTIPTTDQAVTVATGQTATELGGRIHAGGLIKRGAGRLVLTGANAHAGGTVVEAGELLLRDPAALGTGGLEVRNGARVTFDVGTGQLSVSGLDLKVGGILDTATGSLRLASGSYDLAAIKSLILAARGSGSWAGPGITSTSIQPNTPFAVGYRMLGDGSLVVGYSGVGDANMDGRVDGSDVTAVSTSGKYGTGIADAAWWHGDFNYDGVVNIKDLVGLRTSGLFGSGSYLPVVAASVSSSGMFTTPTTAQTTSAQTSSAKTFSNKTLSNKTLSNKTLRATTSSVTTSSLKASPAALFVVPQPVRVVSKIVSDQFPGPVQSAASSKPSSFSP